MNNKRKSLIGKEVKTASGRLAVVKKWHKFEDGWYAEMEGENGYEDVKADAFEDALSLTQSLHNEERVFEEVKEKPQVDFDNLIANFDAICEYALHANHGDTLLPRIKHLQLFFEMMSKSSSFAHKAHLTLKNK